MKRISSDKTKEYILNILVVFRDLCDKYALPYSLVGGTLLGAIRHQGFIPWDDDVDVAMDRPTFNKMIKIFSQENVLPPYLRIEGASLGNSIYPFVKIVDTRTKVIEKTSDEEIGLWIDIFPVDGLPDDTSKIKKLYKKASLLHSMISLIPSNTKGSSKIKMLIKPPIKYICKNIIGSNNINKWCNKLCNQYSYEDSNTVGCIIWGRALEKEAMPKTLFEDKIDVIFEGEKFKGFKNYDFYLKNLYGDYMQIPPVEEREQHLQKVYVSKN